MNIKGNIVTLRAIEEEDLPLLHQWANDPDLQDLLGDIHFPSSMDFHRDWFQRQKNDQLNKRFAVDAPEIGLIGISSVIEIDWRNRHAYHGLMLGSNAVRSKGYGTDAVMTTMRYAFDELNLERLNGGRIEYNEISGVFYKKLGWEDEGLIRNYFFRKGRYWNRIVTGVVKEDYDRVVKATNYWGRKDG
jgi:RimJ/RimL family protein N-acetyltransferase